MKKSVLDQMEKEILHDIENDNFKSVDNVESEIAKIRNLVTNQNRKDQRMNIRISSSDLARIKTKAMEEGIPYQTLVTSILHKYVEGKLKEV